MCGISAFIDKKENIGRSKLIQIIDRFNEHLEHRGPDAMGIWVNENSTIGLGHSRLSVLDISDLANQPMKSDDGRWIISYNGELYNYQAIREHLIKKCGVNFRTSGDTEVFLKGVACLGIKKMLQIAEGMYAAIIVDQHEGDIYLLRDRAGEKPIFFSNQQNYFAVSSEMRPLLEILENPKVNESSLLLYNILRYVPSPNCIVDGIQKLPPGCIGLYNIKTQKIEVMPYFKWEEIEEEIIPNDNSYTAVVELVEKELIRSLSQTMASDVPIGFFLSGGIDSSICVALAKKRIREDISAFTIEFENDPNSEANISRITAEKLNIPIFERKITFEELNQRSNSIIKAMDEPNGDRSCIPTFFLCETAKKNVKVAVGGDGGDELFGGYDRYSIFKSSQHSFSELSLVNILKYYYSNSLKVFGMEGAKRISGSNVEGEQYHLESLSLFFNMGLNHHKSIRFVDFKEYLPGAVLSKVDRMSMLNSLEVRTPFFNRRLLELSARLPSDFLLKNGYGKPILREIASRNGLDHLSKIKKRGFGMPAQYLLNDPIALKKRLRRSVEFICHSSFTKDAVKVDVNTYETTAMKNINSLWATVVLGEWMEGMSCFQ